MAQGSRPVFLSAEWKNLVLLNYEIDPRILTSFIPAGVELDFHEGKTYVSLVAFLFLNTTVFGKIPAFFHRDFEEVNLRFYVVRKHENSTKRGVVFVKEVVPKPLLAWGARVFYSENYVSMPMKSKISMGKSYDYFWGENSLAVETTERAASVSETSFERWITEHYWGYTKVSETKTYEYEVKHPVWNIFQAKNFELKGDLGALYGNEFGPTLQGRPSSVFVADGSEVSVHWPQVL